MLAGVNTGNWALGTKNVPSHASSTSATALTQCGFLSLSMSKARTPSRKSGRVQHCCDTTNSCAIHSAKEACFMSRNNRQIKPMLVGQLAQCLVGVRGTGCGWHRLCFGHTAFGKPIGVMHEITQTACKRLQAVCLGIQGSGWAY